MFEHKHEDEMLWHTGNDIIIVQGYSTLIAVLSLLVVHVNVLIPPPQPLVGKSLQITLSLSLHAFGKVTISKLY